MVNNIHLPTSFLSSLAFRDSRIIVSHIALGLCMKLVDQKLAFLIHPSTDMVLWNFLRWLSVARRDIDETDNVTTPADITVNEQFVVLVAGIFDFVSYSSLRSSCCSLLHEMS